MPGNRGVDRGGGGWQRPAPRQPVCQRAPCARRPGPVPRPHPATPAPAPPSFRTLAPTAAMGGPGDRAATDLVGCGDFLGSKKGNAPGIQRGPVSRRWTRASP